jgi:hypothetical protein
VIPTASGDAAAPAAPVAVTADRNLRVRPAGLRPLWLLGGVLAVLVAVIAGLAFGPVPLPPGSVAAEVLNLLPGVHIHSGLTAREVAIVTQLRLPRVVLGLLSARCSPWPERPTRGSSATRWPIPTCSGWPPGRGWRHCGGRDAHDDR